MLPVVLPQMRSRPSRSIPSNRSFVVHPCRPVLTLPWLRLNTWVPSLMGMAEAEMGG